MAKEGDGKSRQVFKGRRQVLRKRGPPPEKKKKKKKRPVGPSAAAPLYTLPPGRTPHDLTQIPQTQGDLPAATYHTLRPSDK